MNHFDGDTMVGRDTETFEFFDKCLTASDKVICMDADLSDRSLKFFSSYGDSINIVNKHRRSVKDIRCVEERVQWLENLKVEVGSYSDAMFRIAVASQSETEALVLEKELQETYPHLKILTVTGNSKAEKEKQEIFSNINTMLEDVNVFIYSPTLEAGVDIQVPINSIYGISSCKGNSQRAFLQMIGRCRNVLNNVIYIWLDNIPINRSHCFWSFKELVDVCRYDAIVKGGRTLQLEDCYITATIKYPKLYENSIFNKVEELNKSRYLYLNYLKTLAVRKGYTFRLLEREEREKVKRDTQGIKLDWILEAEDITRPGHYSHETEERSELHRREQDDSEAMLQKCVGR